MFTLQALYLLFNKYLTHVAAKKTKEKTKTYK